MAKWGEAAWGTFKWGATQEAGAQPSYTGRYLWILEVAWDGSYSGTNEAPGRLMTPCRGKRGKSAYVNRKGSGLEPIYAGEMTITLDNTDGRYDPYDSNSVIYGTNPQGKPIRLRVKDLPSGVTYPVFEGHIEDIQPVSYPKKQVTITCSDDIEALSKSRVTIPLTFNTTASAAIEAILNNAGFGNYAIEASTHPLTLFSLNKTNAMQEINSLTQASLGQVFVTRDGVIRYYSLGYDGMAEETIDEADILKEIRILQPWDTLCTHIEITANRWVRTQVKKIWESPADIALTAGQTKTFEVSWSGICEPVALDPRLGDYSLVGQGYLGSSSGWITAGLSSITASGCTVSITNTSAFPTSTYLRIRGREYVQSYPASNNQGYVPWQTWVPTTQRQDTSTKIVCTAGDSTIAERNRAYLTMDNQYIQDAAFAQAYADALKAHLENGSKNPVITFENAVDPAQQFGVELFDKVTLTSATLGINAAYYLGQCEWWWEHDSGQAVKTRYTLINHLVSSTAAGTTPEGLQTINDEQNSGSPGGEDPNGNPQLPGQQGGDCNSYAPANGPYPLGGNGTYFNTAGANVITGAMSCRARGSLTHQNPTTVQLTAQATSVTTGLPVTMPTLTARLYRGITSVAASTMRNGLATFAISGTQDINSVAVEINAGGSATTGSYTGDGGDYWYGDEGMSIIEIGSEADTASLTNTAHTDQSSGQIAGYIIIDLGFTAQGGAFGVRWNTVSPGGNPPAYGTVDVSADGSSWSNGGEQGISTYQGTSRLAAGNRYFRIRHTNAANVMFAYCYLTEYEPVESADTKVEVTNFTISNICPIV